MSRAKDRCWTSRLTGFAAAHVFAGLDVRNSRLTVTTTQLTIEEEN